MARKNEHPAWYSKTGYNQYTVYVWDSHRQIYRETITGVSYARAVASVMKSNESTLTTDEVLRRDE